MTLNDNEWFHGSGKRTRLKITKPHSQTSKKLTKPLKFLFVCLLVKKWWKQYANLSWPVAITKNTKNGEIRDAEKEDNKDDHSLRIWLLIVHTFDSTSDILQGTI